MWPIWSRPIIALDTIAFYLGKIVAPISKITATLRHGDRVSALAFSRDGSTLATGSADGEILIWDFAGRKLVRSLSNTSTAINALAFPLPNNRSFLVAGSEDNRMSLWNLNSGTAR